MIKIFYTYGHLSYQSRKGLGIRQVTPCVFGNVIKNA